MSRLQIARSKDLAQLREEGYDLEVRNGYLLVRGVPCVNSRREIARGTLVCKLCLSGDVTIQPDDHVAYFSGEPPRDQNGALFSQIINQDKQTFAEGVEVNCTFSSKPQTPDLKYANYYDKVKAYVSLLSRYAEAIDPKVTAKTFPVSAPENKESVFEYEENASSRANIVVLTQKLATGSIAIVGLGGTGSYVLDLVAKTPVPEIHLYDGDRFLQHNAFRAPGAPSVEDLRGAPMKATYFRDQYSRMRKNIFDHPYYVDADTIQELKNVSFVFICIDRDDARKLIVERLKEFGVSFIDVGMGLQRAANDSLSGILRVSTSTPEHRDLHHTVPLADVAVENEYDQNIQIADMNALNATLAVIKWKKLKGFYYDSAGDFNALYTISANMVTKE